MDTRVRSLLTGSLVFTTLLGIALLAGSPTTASASGGYYKVQPIYIPFPKPGKSWSIRHYGPVGIGIDLINPAFTMRINNVHKGTPAAATGKLKKGMIIESINGRTLKDIDPRVQLANILGEAEATDGLMRLKIKGQGVVAVQIPVLGSYSPTWPVNCPKSDKIVRNLADLLATQETPGWGSVLFLLSTGEEKDLEVVKRWMKDYNGTNHYPWFNGMQGMGVCEYYLRTGDQRMLPVIKGMTEELRKQIYNGGWSGRGKASFTYVGGGQLSAAGVPCLTFLLLARQCGVDVDEHTLQSSLRHFFRFAGRGNVAYGDHNPEGGYRDNGKTAALALAMSAAAGLTPQGERSIYAAARDNSAMKSFYASSWFNRAHTGGGIGEMWHANAMQLVREKKPVQWRSFMNERRWHFELSRRANGAIGIDDGARYDKAAGEHSRSWGTIHALVYTAHRKKLRLFGAPPTPWTKSYPLPVRPWGTPADDIFQSLIPAEHAPGQRLDISGEIIPTDASAPLMGRLSRHAEDPEYLWKYAHHPEYGVRVATVRNIVRQGQVDVVLRMLKSDDPRVRQVGLEAISGIFKGKTLSNAQITGEMWDLVGGMIDDPNESWFVALTAMKALGRAPRSKVEPHVDRIVHFLKNDDWWMHTAALRAIRSVAVDDRYYQKVLPAVADIVATQYAFNAAQPVRDITKQFKNASPAAKRLALELFGEAYEAIPDPIVAPGGQITPNQTSVIRGQALGFLRAIPGSESVLLKMPKLNAKWQATKKDADLYVFDRHVPNPEVMGRWIVVDKVGSIASYKGGTRKHKKLPYRQITFRGQGKTDNSARWWTGTTLLNLSSNEALQMTIKQVAGKPTLFIEIGGFSASKPNDWKSGYYVLTKK